MLLGDTLDDCEGCCDKAEVLVEDFMFPVEALIDVINALVEDCVIFLVEALADGLTEVSVEDCVGVLTVAFFEEDNSEFLSLEAGNEALLEVSDEVFVVFRLGRFDLSRVFRSATRCLAALRRSSKSLERGLSEGNGLLTLPVLVSSVIPAQPTIGSAPVKQQKMTLEPGDDDL